MPLEAGKAVALRSDGRRSLRLIGHKLLKTLRGPQFPIGPEDPRHAIKNGGHSSRKKAVAGALLSEPLLEREIFPYKEGGVSQEQRGLPLSTLACNSHSSRLAGVPGVGLGSPRAWRVRMSSWTMPAPSSASFPPGGSAARLGSSEERRRRRRAAWSSVQRKPKSREREQCN